MAKHKIKKVGNKKDYGRVANRPRLIDPATVNWTTPKMVEILKNLPKHLVEPFKELVEDITFETRSRARSSYRQWKILAALVIAGWRRSGEPTKCRADDLY